MLTHSCFVIIVVQFRRQPLPPIITALVSYYSRGRIEGGPRERGSFTCHGALFRFSPDGIGFKYGQDDVVLRWVDGSERGGLVVGALGNHIT